MNCFILDLYAENITEGLMRLGHAVCDEENRFRHCNHKATTWPTLNLPANTEKIENLFETQCLKLSRNSKLDRGRESV